MRKNRINKYNLTDVSTSESKSSINNFILFNTVHNYKTVEPLIFEEITFGLCIKGESLIKINFEEYKVTKNTLINIQSNSIIEILSKSEDFKVLSLFFSFDFISSFINYHDYGITEKIRELPILNIKEKDMMDLIDFHMLISKIYNLDEATIFKENMIKGILMAYLTKMASLYLSANIEAHKQSLLKNDFKNKFLKLVWQYHKKERTVNFYAEKMNMTNRNLSRNIFKLTNRTALAWINDFVISKIKLLLKTSDMTATQISEEYNFPSPSLFGRFFKKHTGMTPNKYRNRIN